jgi:3-dehydroquinate synthetase
MAVKIRLIEADPWEQSARAALNFGHTIGHALEHATRFRLRHGEAVSIGMVVEARLAARIGLAQAGLAEEVSSILSGLGLPTTIPQGIRPKDLAGASGS